MVILDTRDLHFVIGGGVASPGEVAGGSVQGGVIGFLGGVARGAAIGAAIGGAFVVIRSAMLTTRRN